MIVYQTRADGVFVGTVEADESPLEPGVWLIPGGAVTEMPPDFEYPNRARWENGKWVIELTPEEQQEEPPEVDANNIPKSVSDRQFAQALAELNYITWDEARAWGARGEIPLQFKDAVEQIEDPTIKNRALMFLEAAQSFERHHPMTLTLANFLGWTDEQLDGLWLFANTL